MQPASSPPDAPLVERLEALLFAAGRPVAVEELADLLELESGLVEAALHQVASGLQGHGVALLRVAGGYRLASRPEHAEAIRRLLQPPPQKLTPARLETLAIVAYRQPVTTGELEAVRGVDSGATLRALLELGLVELRGRRKDRPGRPWQYGTTARFLEEFGLDTLADLPRLEELEV
ncbi:MAG: SMC-Scp complex subunit ScpB [Fimbriimonadaceae bacterium]|nr:SMC-Scp complex subunit ScpB [Fimbriimonadaceae bacterium]